MLSAHRLFFSVVLVSAIMRNTADSMTTDSPTTPSTTNNSNTTLSTVTSPTHTTLSTHTEASPTSSATPTTPQSEVTGPQGSTALSNESSTTTTTQSPTSPANTAEIPGNTTHITANVSAETHSSPTANSAMATSIDPSTTPANTTTSTDAPSSTPASTTSAGVINGTSTVPQNATEPSNTVTCPIPCPALSTCINGTCRCLAGTILSGEACVEAKVFPGTLRVNRTFVEDMRNPRSAAFRSISSEIIAALREAFRNITGYINSTVLELTPGSVVATVDSTFEPNSPATQEMTTQAISRAINSSDGILAGATFTVTSLCDQSPPPCDVDTMMCRGSDNGRPNCTCMSGFVPIDFSDRTCRACPSGQRSVDNQCVPCSFGYSGFNCNDSSLLALVVVACVLGGLLLILIVAMIIYFAITKKNPKYADITSSQISVEQYHSWPAQSLPAIPRATLSSNANSGNVMEMSNQGTRRNQSNGLTGSYDVTSVDNMNTFKGKNPSRYSYLVQGHENPYFIPADEPRST